MRKLLLASVALIGIGLVASSPAYPADLPYRPGETCADGRCTAPWTWTGIYVGGHLGAGIGTNDWSVSSVTFPSGTFPAQGLAAAQTVNGFLGGGQVGANLQLSRIVLGVQGDFSRADLSGTGDCFTGVGVVNSLFGATTNPGRCDAKTSWLATVTSRLGSAIDHALLYVKGGGAWIHDWHNLTVGADNINPPVSFSSSAGETRIGWTVGVGVEYMLLSNWSGFIEFDYLNFGTSSASFTIPPNCCGPATNATLISTDIRERIQVVKAGVNFRF